ncbi:MAG: hypothetical protein ABJX32_13305 [Tateyamaria sp.]|uniref:hypothetical protein n=1 Tax=Tateyamaria sp. TaxID=1929288 RepID=UPI00329D5588
MISLRKNLINHSISTSLLIGAMAVSASMVSAATLTDPSTDTLNLTKTRTGVIAPNVTPWDEISGNYGDPVSFAGIQWETVNDNTATGTGVFDPFLTILASNREFESGYNAVSRSGSDEQFDAKYTGGPDGGRTHAIRYDDLEVVNVGGVETLKFALDFNESNNGDVDPLLSLRTFKLYSSADANIDGAKLDPEDPLADSVWVDSDGNELAETRVKLEYDLDAFSDKTVNLDYGIASSGQGRADLFIYVPVSEFSAPLEYVVLYSEFGRVCTRTTGGGQPVESCEADYYENSTGFEEWSVLLKDAPVVCEGSQILVNGQCLPGTTGEEPPAVPLPAGLPLLLTALGLGAFMSKRARKSA